MDGEVNELIQQLKSNNTLSKEVINNKNEAFELNKEDLEQFVLNSSGKLIKDSMEMITNMKDYVTAGSAADDVHAFSELFKASTHAMEILNKILIQNKRGETTKEVKQMDIDSKQKGGNDESQKVLISRDDIVKQLMDSAHLIDAEVIES